MRRTVVATKGFNAPRPSGSHLPAEVATAAASTNSHRTRSASKQRNASSPSSNKATRKSTSTTNGSESKNSTATTTSSPETPSGRVGSSGVVTYTLPNRGVLSGHFNANHLRRGYRRDTTGSDDPFVSSLHPHSTAPTTTSSHNEKASATSSQVSASSNTLKFSCEERQGSREVSRKRSRSPSTHIAPREVTALPPPQPQPQRTVASPDQASLSGTLSEVYASMPSRASRRLSSYIATAHVTRNVFYPPPAELTVASPPNPADPTLLQKSPHHDPSDHGKPVPWTRGGEGSSHGPMNAHGATTSKDTLAPVFHTPERNQMPLSSEDQTVGSRGGGSAPRVSAESGTALSSSTTTSQSGTWFLSALEHQQRVSTTVFTQAPLSSSPYSDSAVPSPSGILQVPQASVQEQQQNHDKLCKPPPPSSTSPLLTEKLLNFSQASSEQERVLLQTSPGASPPMSTKTFRTSPPELPPMQLGWNTEKVMTASDKKDGEAAASHFTAATTEGVPNAYFSEIPLHTEAATTTTTSIAFSTVVPDASLPNTFPTKSNQNNLRKSSVTGLIFPAVEEEPVESEEALQREMAEDLRLSMDVAFTPSGNGNGAPPLLSQSSFMHEEEEREERENGDKALSVSARKESQQVTPAPSEIPILADASLSGSARAYGADIATGFRVGVDNNLADSPHPPPPPHASVNEDFLTKSACDVFESTSNSGSTETTALSHFLSLTPQPPPQQSPFSWPIYDSPLPHLPVTLTSDKGEKVSLAVSAAAAAAAVIGSSKGVGSRHRTVFSFSSRKDLSATDGSGEGDVAQTSSLAVVTAPLPESRPSTSCPFAEKRETECTTVIRLSSETSVAHTDKDGEHVEAPVLALAAQQPDDANTESSVETSLCEKPTITERNRETSTAAHAVSQSSPVATTVAGGRTTSMKRREDTSTMDVALDNACSPVLSSATKLFPPPSLLLLSKTAQAQDTTPPLRVFSAATTAPARPARTCFTLHSTAQSVEATENSNSNTLTMTMMDSENSNSNSMKVPLPPSQKIDVAPLIAATCESAGAHPSLFDDSSVTQINGTAMPAMPLNSGAMHHSPDHFAIHSRAGGIEEILHRVDTKSARLDTLESSMAHHRTPADTFTTLNTIMEGNSVPVHPPPSPPSSNMAALPLVNDHHNTNNTNVLRCGTETRPSNVSPPPGEPFYDLPRSVGDFYATRRGVTKLYDWQHELLTQPEIRRGRSFIYSLPTSGGKTLVAELSLLRCVLNRRQSCFFVLPFVSLAEEKTLALQPLTTVVDFSVDGHYGSAGRFPLCSAPAIYVCTIEKANSLLNYLLEEDRIAEIGAVVVDELHMVGESRRGATLELFLSKLLMIDEARKEQRTKVAAKAHQQHQHADGPHGGATHAMTPAQVWPENEQDVSEGEEGYCPDADAAGRRDQQAAEAETFIDPGPLQIIGMSATVPNLHTIAEWLHAACFERDFRPVPLHAYSVVGGLVLRDGQQNERNLSGNSVNQYLLELATEIPDASVLVFCASRQQCVDTARGIVNYMKAQAIAGQQQLSIPGDALPSEGRQCSVLEMPFPNGTTKPAVSSVSSQASFAVKTLLAELEALAHYEASQLSEIVPHGVAFHHGGLLAEERELIEAAFRRKNIRILCSTSTLAAGVNLPARRVIIKTPYVGRDFLTKSRYLQMCGRAGRAGLDPYGESYLLLSRRDQSRGHALMHASVEPCCSQMLEDDQTLTRSLLECIGVGLVTDSVSARLWSASLLSSYAVGSVDGKWREYVEASSSPSLKDAAVGYPFLIAAPLALCATSTTITAVAPANETENSRPMPVPVQPSIPLTSVSMAALQSMVRTALDTLARCGLVSVTPAHREDEERFGEGEEKGNDTSTMGGAAQKTAKVEGDDGELQVRITPFGSSSVRSCFSVEEALLLREELDELRHTGLILSDDLHLCYFLTPLREVGECDWALLRLMISRMNDSRQRIASLLGVDPYFIDQQAMGLGGPLQATEDGRRRLFTAKRFYVALMLADVLAEVPMTTVEQRYNVNRGQLQNLMRSASMFSSSITSFCHAMEWYSLEAVLSSFVKRLGFGVKPDLLPLMEIRGMQPPRARALWNAGFKKLAHVAAADADDMVAKVKQMNPPDSKSAKFFTKRSALMVIREANLAVQSQIKEKKGELQELTKRSRTSR